MYGKTITIKFRLPQGKFGSYPARINATKDKKLVRLTLCQGDPGRLEQTAIIASCLNNHRPYRWI